MIRHFPLFSLRRSIPLLILACVLLLLLGSHLVLKPYISRLFYQTAETNLAYTLNRLQGGMEYLLSRDDLEGVRREIAATGVHEEIRHLLVMDEAMIILAATPAGFEGQHLDQVSLHVDRRLPFQALQEQGAIIQLVTRDEHSLYGLISIQLPDGEYSSHLQGDSGLILLELDLNHAAQQGWYHLESVFLWVSFAIGVLAILLWVWSEWFIGRRLGVITEAVNRIREGHLDQPIPLSGRDELGVIAAALNHMQVSLRSSRDELLRTHEQMDSILRHIPSMVYIKNLQGHYTLGNRHFYNYFGSDPLGKQVFDLLEPPYAAEIQYYDDEVVRTRRPQQFEISFPISGVMHSWFMVKFPLFDDRGEPEAICSVATNVTEQERNAYMLNVSKRIFEHAAEGIMITDAQNRVVDVNPSFERISGFQRKAVLGRDPAFLKSDLHDSDFYQSLWQQVTTEGSWKGELWNKRPDGTAYPVRLSISGIRDRHGMISGYFGIFEDVSEEYQARTRLRKLAYRDSLTGLFNRLAFKEKVHEFLARARRYHENFALLFVDLDLFKDVNDSFGHEAGDLLLKQVADRILSQVRDSDIVSRLGGDEFTLLISPVENDIALASIAENLIDVLSQPFQLNDVEVTIGCSVGVVSYPRDGENLDQLMRHADAAMYHAKAMGRGCYAFFDVELDQRNHRLMQIKHGLRQALARDEMHLVYQPEINLQTGQVFGFEVLMRWHSDELGWVSPAEFIPVAEESDSIADLTRWMLIKACRELLPRLETGMQMAVNISPRQFGGDRWLALIRQCIDEEGLDPTRLCIEITEGALIRDMDQAVVQLSELRKLGVSVAIDDFGTGYSSLSYLKRLPIDYLKIDRTFVADIEQDQDDQAIIRAIINLADSLGISVIAEGVESEAQLDFLKSLDCDIAQGYFFAHPQAIDKIKC
ncbi:MAG: EAL domain-containing protein [Nitrincola lacisaponensis]|uniref:bifunctional diguanylate cyclase/phosphodiesterase n=1 Tax=Nitrincola lacisaponensis TaxID=267850 RepID=UPI00391DB53D